MIYLKERGFLTAINGEKKESPSWLNDRIKDLEQKLIDKDR
jgi:hypothetical protein